MTNVSPERLFCDEARKYLLSFSNEGVTPEVLDRYLEPGERLKATDLNGVYLQLLYSAQNANMRTGVITGSMDDGMMAIKPVLKSFDPSAVTQHYGNDWEMLLDDIVAVARPNGKIRRTNRSIWPQFCRSALSGATFVSQFSDANDFYAWADQLSSSPHRARDLPLEISKRVSGLGFALSCDFVKELGYINYAKPDVHIRKILTGLGVISEPVNAPDVLDAAIEFSKRADLPPYYVDKLMWLVGSGWFYHHQEIRQLQTKRDQFVELMRPSFSASA